MKHTLAPTRERLIAAAVLLFQSRGYFATSVSDILVEAQAPKGSLYHHFPAGKAELAEAAVAAISHDVLTLLNGAYEASTPPAQLVRELAHAMAAWMRKTNGAQSALFSVLALECAEREPRVHAAVRAAYAAWRTVLSRCLKGDRAHARATADLIIATLEGGLILARAEGRAAPLIGSSERLAALLERAA